jgi:hypothetical protein
MFLGFVSLNETLTAAFCTRNASTRVPTDATGSVTARIYGPAGFIETITLALLDASNTDGLYSLAIAPTGAGGYEAGVTYFARVSFTVSAVAQAEVLSFQVS